MIQVFHLTFSCPHSDQVETVQVGLTRMQHSTCLGSINPNRTKTLAPAPIPKQIVFLRLNCSNSSSTIPAISSIVGYTYSYWKQMKS